MNQEPISNLIENLLPIWYLILVCKDIRCYLLELMMASGSPTSEGEWVAYKRFFRIKCSISVGRKIYFIFITYLRFTHPFQYIVKNKNKTHIERERVHGSHWPAADLNCIGKFEINQIGYNKMVVI